MCCSVGGPYAYPRLLTSVVCRLNAIVATTYYCAMWSKKYIFYSLYILLQAVEFVYQPLPVYIVSLVICVSNGVCPGAILMVAPASPPPPPTERQRATAASPCHPLLSLHG